MNAQWIFLFAFTSTALTASSETCAPCHPAETSSFANTGMARALETAGNSAILKANPRLTARIGGYSYAIETTSSGAIYTVIGGKETVRVPLEWAFGHGAVGQTYLYQQDGNWYESRVSYFSALKNLDVTIGQQAIAPHSVLEAAGRLAAPAEVRACFDCHATNVKRTLPVSLSSIVPGVQCERCHGPSDAHVKNHQPMNTLRTQTAGEMSDSCGSCHRTWAQVAAAGPRGIQNVRFQPYRLGNSKCFDANDDRIRCTECHNPHRSLETSLSVYDAKCTACHSRSAAPATSAAKHICKVATSGCVTCHMPKLNLDGAHSSFTDHCIRVVKRNEKYPD